MRTAIVDAVGLGTSFGAPTRKENELAKLILENNRYIEMIRFVSSGTEAVMSAIRLARGVTVVPRYHQVRRLLPRSRGRPGGAGGSGLSTFGISSSAGVPDAVANDTIVVPLNDQRALEGGDLRLRARHRGGDHRTDSGEQRFVAADERVPGIPARILPDATGSC